MLFEQQCASRARRMPTFFIGDHRHLGPYAAETIARALQAARSSTGGRVYARPFMISRQYNAGRPYAFSRYMLRRSFD